jgi:predicted transcriptional regulator
MSSKERVSDFMSKRTCLSKRKINCNSFCSIVAYPQNFVKDIAKVMQDVKIDCIPVIFSPWNKRQIGFIELKEIKSFLNE